MTTPLLLSETEPIEYRNLVKYLTVGRYVKWKTTEGYINFVCDDYITICFREYDNNDPSAKNRKNQCCLLVYKEHWEDLEFEPIKQYGKSYSGKVNDHPGNEYLPQNMHREIETETDEK